MHGCADAPRPHPTHTRQGKRTVPVPRLDRLRTLWCIAAAGVLCALPASPAGRVSIKVATLAPDGSAWMKSFRKMDREIRVRTRNAVRFKVYPGGVQGDEMDVLRKIDADQLDGGGFTGLGMGRIYPDTLVVAVPLLVGTYDEVDYLKKELGAEFERGIERSGFVLLGWQEVGFVYLFSKNPVTTIEDFRKSKIWCWEGDPVAPHVFKAAKINPVYLAMHDVLPALQTGAIDTTYNSPLGAVVLQWHTKVSYMTDCPLTYALSGLVVTRAKFSQIPAEHQPVVKAICTRHLKQQIQLTRRANGEAVDALRKRGIQTVSLTPEARQELRSIFVKAGETLSGTTFSRSVFDRANKLLAANRAAPGNGP